MKKKKYFQDLVFAKTKLIPRGKVTTYKLLAEAIGYPKAARVVGNALNKNCDPKVPCHRVVRSDGDIGGYNKGAAFKKDFLQKEGVELVNHRVDFEKYLFNFNRK